MKNFDISQEDGDSAQTKKSWYLFGESGYLGPYTDFQIIQMIEQKKVDGQYKVWSQELEKWQTISSLPQFKTAVEMAKNTLATLQTKTGPESEWVSSDELWRQIRGQNLFRSEELSYLNEPEFNQLHKIPVIEKLHSGAQKNQRLSLAFSVGILVSVALVWFLNFHTKPPLNSLSGDLPDVSRQENREVKAAIAEAANIGGPSAALGLIKKEGQEPSFVLGSNQPDGTGFKMKIEGLPETLVGAFRFSTQAVLILKNGIARSQSLLKDNGKPISAGEYKVSVFCDACGESGVLAEKVYFLGGTRNLEYDLNLRQYHDRVRQQARAELAEVKQLAETLERELIDSSTHFEAALAQNKIQDWNSFAPKWQSMHGQLGEIINKWDVQNSRGEVFYSDIFSSLKQTFEMLGQTHELQSKYVAMMNSKASPLNELETHISSESSTAQSSLLSLRGKIKMVERLPLSSNGMPRTE
jgi:hypothetical protein